MKIPITVIILLFVSLIFLNSCKKERTEDFVDEPLPVTDNNIKKDTSKFNETKQKTETKVIEEKPIAVISPVEAFNYIGKPVTLKGLIVEINKREKVAYLNFTERYPENPCAAVIFAEKFEEFSDMSELNNKNVQITGRVSTYKGKPQIILTSRSQLKILN